jgi:archaellum component FlaC
MPNRRKVVQAKSSKVIWRADEIDSEIKKIELEAISNLTMDCHDEIERLKKEEKELRTRLSKIEALLNIHRERYKVLSSFYEHKLILYKETE